MNFPRQTLGAWMEKGARALPPSVRALKREWRAGDYLPVEETPVKVLAPEGKGKGAPGFLWVASAVGGAVIFEFQPGRGKELAVAWRGDFQGPLPRDGYGLYGALAKDDPGLIPGGGWHPARRKFVDALAERPAEAGGRVTERRQLYWVERHARAESLKPEPRLKGRQEISRPRLTALPPQLAVWREKYLPQSPRGKACR